nr:hypothetical protein 18 [Bacillaceae bacterium]
MNQKQIIEFAIKGIAAEIDEKEKQVRKGYKILDDIENGNIVYTKKSPYEIREIITKLKAEIEDLDKKKFDLTWELTINEELQ